MELYELLFHAYISAFDGYTTKREVIVRRKKWHSFAGGLNNKVEYGHSGKSVANLVLDLKTEFYVLKLVSKAEAKKRRSDLKKVTARLAKRETEFLQRRYDDVEIDEFYRYLNRHSELILKVLPIEDRYVEYEMARIRGQIVDMVQTDPTVEYAKTREMKRHFHLHLGPTNSGKTYDSIQRLKAAKHGVYLGPLRLLALEIYDTMMDAGVPCQMITGEEHIFDENARVSSQTIETLEIGDRYDIAVIDECQMIDDGSRGHAWSKAVLGIMADDIYVCASKNIEKLLVGIIESCNDTYDITYHERKTQLLVEDKMVSLSPKDLADNIQKGDCLITFSKRTVLDLAARLELAGLKASVIYGKLPPETRKREVARFTQGETDVVVATDAIGMGVNLPIRRIIMTANMKYDGHDIRKISPSEVLQIAGRAGRFGLYNEGYVTTSIKGYLDELKAIMQMELPDIDSARLGFPKVLLSLDESLDAIINTWVSIKAKPPYQKISVEEMIFLYNTLKTYSRDFSQVPDGDNKQVIYGMISVPLDIRNNEVVRQWVDYCKDYASAPGLKFPKMPYMRAGKDLEAYETYYKLLDLYHLFSNSLGKDMDEDRLLAEKAWVEERIESIINGSKNRFVRKCMYCGQTLPLDATFRLCDDCHKIRAGSFSRGRR